MSNISTIFSGIQPTGNLHLGNYLGSISNWLDLQNHHKCLFGIMDLHAITIPQNPEKLRNHIIETAIIYLASGIDPKKSTIFVQSDIKEHAELAWILSCITPLGWLNRMTQFKEKSINNEHLGLYSYPVLMAADVLLYNTDIVPVGEDQKQHLELTRDIAGAFNREFKTNFFKLPKPMILGNCTRVMSLQDGTKKMSKSDNSDLSRINLMDNKDNIIKKIKKAKTDSQIGITYDKKRPEIYNLINIFAAISDKKPEEIANIYQNSGTGDFKKDLTENLAEKLDSIQNKIKSFKDDPEFIENILITGKEKAGEIATQNIKKIKQIVGLK